MSPAAAARRTAQRVSRPWLGFAVVAALALLTAGFFANAPAASDDGRATLSVGDETYRFVPTTCTITDDTFVVAGTGMHDGRPFSVTAGQKMIELAIGVDNELATPAPEDAWLSSEEPPTWTGTDDGAAHGVAAAAALVDRNDPDGAPVDASLAATCST